MGKRYAYSELHLSDTSGFTPSSATLKATNKSGSIDLTGLTAGTTYYYRLLHRDVRGLVGAMSPQGSFVAGYVTDVVVDNIDASKVKSGILPIARLADVPATSLVTALHRNTKCVVDAGVPEPTCTRTQQIPFGGKSINDGFFVVDTLQEMTKTESAYDTFTPVASEIVRLRVQVHARGTFITLGCRGQLVVQDVTATAAVASSRWRAAEVAPDGTVEIIAELDEQVALIGNHAHRAFLTIVDRDGAPFANAATIKGRDPASGIAGSFFEAVGVPNE